MTRLLPQDARVVEIASGFGLIALVVVLAFGVRVANLLDVQPFEFWMVMCAALGVLQVISLLSDELDFLRCAVSLFTGSLWVWLSLIGIGTYIDPSDFAAFFLGISNLYAFSLNSLILKAAWKS